MQILMRIPGHIPQLLHLTATLAVHTWSASLPPGVRRSQETYFYVVVSYATKIICITQSAVNDARMGRAAAHVSGGTCAAAIILDAPYAASVTPWERTRWQV